MDRSLCPECSGSTPSGCWQYGDRPYRLARGKPPRQQRPYRRGLRLALLPEPVLVGAVSHAYTASWDADRPFDLPSLEESQAFIVDYQTARGSEFDADELEAADAGHLYALAYGARCQHSDAVLKIFPQSSGEDGYGTQLRERGARWLIPES